MARSASQRDRPGFHAPSLQIKDGRYTDETVTNAYNLAVGNISDAIFDLILGNRNFENGGERL